MRASDSFIAGFLVVCLSLASPAHAVFFQDRGQTEVTDQPNRLIVKYASQADPRGGARMNAASLAKSAEIQTLNRRYNLSEERKLLPESALHTRGSAFENVRILTFPQGTNIELLAFEYGELDFVEYAQPDYQLELLLPPDDSLYAQQWALDNNGQGTYYVDRLPGVGNDTLAISFGNADADIDFQEVYENPPDNTHTVVVAIVDTGVDWDHPDLVDNIWSNPGEIPDNGLDDDHNGYIDDVVGWDMASEDFGDVPGYEDNDPTDNYGHGTHCAGIVSAVLNNGLGVVGAAPDARIMGLKFYPYGSMAAAVKGIIYAVDNGADVISMSWGRNFALPIVHEALIYARARGVICVASAGNDGVDLKKYPAAYAEALAVGATNDLDQVAAFSSIGEQVDLCAPGVSILSLRAEGTDMYGELPSEPDVHIVNDWYYLASGTSMSGPYVAAAAAYLRAVSPGLDHSVVESVLETTADDIIDPYDSGWSYPGPDIYSGHGRLNLAAALAAVPHVRAVFDSPARNAVVSGDVDIYGSADGADFVDYVLDVGEGLVPDSWIEIDAGFSPVSDGFLGTWYTNDLAGVYTLRLRLGETNMITRTVFVAGAPLAEITFPFEGGSASGEISVIGSAHCPDYDRALLEWGAGASPTTWDTAAVMTSLVYDGELGVLPGTFVADGEYSIRLSVYSSIGLEDSHTIVFDIASLFSGDNGWSFDVADNLAFSATYADLDGDRRNEILVGTMTRMLVLNTDGTEKTIGVPSFPSDDYRVVPAVGRLDGDHLDDIVVVTGSGTMYGYPSQADPFQISLDIAPSTHRVPSKTNEVSKVFLKDIDGDGIDEIHYVVGTSTGCFLYQSDGTPWDCDSPTPFSYKRYLPADLDGDGQGEIYVVYEGLLTQLDACGNTVNSFLMEDNGEGLSHFVADLSAVDLDGDGDGELIISGAYPEGTAYSNYWLYAFDEGLTLVPGWPRNTGIDGYLSPNHPVFADLDEDGSLEYIMSYFEFTNGYIYVWRLDGSPMMGDSAFGGYFASSGTPGTFSPPIIADSDGDGYEDIFVGCGPDMFSSFPHERIYGLSRNAEALQGYPMGISHEVPYSAGNIPVIGDVDRDGSLDITYVSDCGHKVCFGNYPGVSFDPKSATSPIWRYNRRLNNTYLVPQPWLCQGQTGNVDCDPFDVVDITDIQTLVDNQFLSLTPLCCLEETDIDMSGFVDITDLMMLIDNQFLSLTPLPFCP
ncbi:MAG: S8 family serine peptidase [bacterium]|nr:S8 family serine peptidase [bacterium]